MGVQLKKKTERNMQLKLVVSFDDAIDWEKSYAEQDLSPDEKKAFYQKSHDLSKLVFLDGMSPTLFVFEHPARADVSRKVRSIYARMASGGGQGSVDLFTELYNEAFVGTEEGFEAPLVTAPRVNGKIKEDFIQALEDSDVFNELALAFTSALDRTRLADYDKKK